MFRLSTKLWCTLIVAMALNIVFHRFNIIYNFDILC